MSNLSGFAKCNRRHCNDCTVMSNLSGFAKRNRPPELKHGRLNVTKCNSSYNKIYPFMSAGKIIKFIKYGKMKKKLLSFIEKGGLV